MRFLSLSLVLVGLLAGPMSAVSADKAELRKLARLPTINLLFKFGFDGSGIATGGEKRNVTAEIAELRKTLRGEPEDAEAHLELSRLHRKQDGGVAAAETSLNKAIELFSKRVVTEPQNGRLLASYGEALNAAKKTDEAEKMFRKSVEVSPNEWSCRASLGSFLIARAFAAVTDKNDFSSVLSLLGPGMPKPPPNDVIEQAQKTMAEAMACYDKAVGLSPTNPVVYARRGAARSARNTFAIYLRASRGEKPGARELSADYFTEDGLQDFKKAAELDTKNYPAIGTVVLFEMARTILKSGDTMPSPRQLWAGMAEKSQQTVREQLSNLEKLGADSDKRVASGASEFRGILEFYLLNDLPGAETTLRHAVTLDPEREQAWEMLMATHVTKQDFAGVLRVAEDRVKIRNTARNHLLVAKAHEKLGKLTLAEEQVRAALKLNPQDINSRVAQAALFLKVGTEAALKQADTQLKGIELLMTAQVSTAEELNNFLLTRAIYLGMTDQPAEGRRLVEDVLKEAGDNDYAKMLLAALEK